MNSRLTLLALVAVLLAAFAVPALAAPTEEAGSVQGLATRALAKARLALLTARSAKSESRRAARTAEAALNAAGKAVGPTGATGPQGPAGAGALVKTASVTAGVGTESETYVPLAGGPSVSVDVPASGLIEVWAQVTIEEEGTVALFQDGQKVAGQNPGCGVEEEGRGLLASYVEGEAFTLATPGGFSFGPFCGTFGPPSSVFFQTSPGAHTYELRYATCGCSPEPTFSNRSLFVAPRP